MPLAPIDSARVLCRAVDGLRFSPPVTYVYNPLDYAAAAHEAYLQRFASPPKDVLFLGMNPGPWGMAQTGVPFGEIAAVRDWMGITAPIHRPVPMHPKRPIEGFACTRSEVSGRRLWGLFAQRFGSADAFFARHFVANYCPLVFMTASGANLTPDKLPAAETAPLLAACDRHLRDLVQALRPRWVVGVGAWAETRARQALTGLNISFARVLHPSPASPTANRGWAEAATRQLVQAGIWSE
jgi:single-strand selective monofunctional uracil DNA glycosylase